MQAHHLSWVPKRFPGIPTNDRFLHEAQRPRARGPTGTRKALSRSEEDEHKKIGRVSFGAAAQLAATLRAALYLRCTCVAVGLEPTCETFLSRCRHRATTAEVPFSE